MLEPIINLEQVCGYLQNKYNLRGVTTVDSSFNPIGVAIGEESHVHIIYTRGKKVNHLSGLKTLARLSWAPSERSDYDRVIEYRIAKVARHVETPHTLTLHLATDGLFETEIQKVDDGWRSKLKRTPTIDPKLCELLSGKPVNYL